MTSEIIVMNKHGVAMAADSAATRWPENHSHHRQRKLFSLSPHHSVGIMVYNRLRFNGVPWETVFKLYQNRLGDEPLESLEAYQHSFVDFIASHHELFRHDQGNLNWLYDGFDYLKTFGNRISWDWQQKNDTSSRSLKDYTAARIEAEICELEKRDAAFSLSFEKLRRLAMHELNKFGHDYLDRAFDLFPLSADLRARLVTLLILMTVKNDFSFGYTGIVIAGFGRDNIFPSVAHTHLGGLYFGHLKYETMPVTTIDNLNQAQIIPYAISETISAFIKGVHPDYESFSLNEAKKSMAACLKDIPGNHAEKIVETHFQDCKQKLTHYILSHHVQPIIDSIKFLPQDGLSCVAESLITITSFKTQIMPETGFVGGDIDVAVISKGEGFSWVKRKGERKEGGFHETALSATGF